MIKCDVVKKEPLMMSGTFDTLTYEVSQIVYQYATKVVSPNVELSKCKNEIEYVKKFLNNMEPMWECISFLIAQEYTGNHDDLLEKSEKVDLSALNYILKKINDDDKDKENT